MLEIVQLNSLYYRNLEEIKMRFAVAWKLVSCFLTSVLPVGPSDNAGLTVSPPCFTPQTLAEVPQRCPQGPSNQLQALQP